MGHMEKLELLVNHQKQIVQLLKEEVHINPLARKTMVEFWEAELTNTEERLYHIRGAHEVCDVQKGG